MASTLAEPPSDPFLRELRQFCLCRLPSRLLPGEGEPVHARGCTRCGPAPFQGALYFKLRFSYWIRLHLTLRFVILRKNQHAVSLPDPREVYDEMTIAHCEILHNHCQEPKQV